MQKIATYLKETKVELDKVAWPKWSLAFTHTFVVVLIAFIVGYLSGLFDSIFKMGLGRLLGL